MTEKARERGFLEAEEQRAANGHSTGQRACDHLESSPCLEQKQYVAKLFRRARSA